MKNSLGFTHQSMFYKLLVKKKPLLLEEPANFIKSYQET